MAELLRVRMSGRMYYAAIIVLAILVSAVFSLAPLVLGPLIPFVWAGALLAGAIVYLFVRSHFIEFGEWEIHAQTGLLNTRSFYAPYTNVDNVSVHAKLFERLIGLCELRVDTTGRADTEIVMRNIPADKAQEAINIINEMRSKAKSQKKEDEKK